MLDWSKILGFIALILFLLGFLMVNRFKREFQNLDNEQVMPRQFFDKWNRQFSVLIGLTILATILGIVSIFMR